MEAYIKQWADDLKAQRKVTIQPQPVADPETPLTPLLDRLKRVIDSLTLPQRQQGLPLEFYRERLLGRQSGRKVHAGELGAALRKLGYIRRRGWCESENGFRALWWPPK
ncbi:MAG: hypothetical protein QT04_C0006G0006 [archaeon GW2011_AR11]|nr:MAG: hypothetical protein QT04_C0006G0006 [archaeon GW2011_AR11]